MYRYSVDNAVTYTPDDFVLFRESPFAAWMERLTLENPDHGIPPDLHSVEPRQSPEDELVYSEIVDTLRAEARDVALISADLDEPSRRAATLSAMRDGADFIVNGLLALGPLCGTANLLMRTSGYSDLGDYLYVPCDTQAQTTLHSAFRLCFLADLLHSLQGQLPPQMLIIREDADVVPMHTDDHIYYYRAVKKRFMDDMRNFRKHRMPDPTESAHFGRWAECASEVLKQRALTERADSEAAFDEAAEIAAVPELQVAGMATSGAPVYERREQQQAASTPPQQHSAQLHGINAQQSAAMASHTLAEQARTLAPGSYRAGVGPGPTPNLARFAKNRPAAVASQAGGSEAKSSKLESPAVAEKLELDLVELDLVELEAPEAESLELDLVALEPDGSQSSASAPQPDCRGVDVALQNLEFIGSTTGRSPLIDKVPEWKVDESLAQAPPPTLRDSSFLRRSSGDSQNSENNVAATQKNVVREQLPELDPPAPFLLPPDEVLIVDKNPRQPKPHPLDSDGFTAGSASVVDMDSAPVDTDSAPPPTLAPVVESLLSERNVGENDGGNADESSVLLQHARRKSDATCSGADPDEVPSPTRSFSSSLITSEDIEDY